MSALVTLEPWGGDDLSLLERLMGDPGMTEHLGGPEGPDKLRERQGRYERLEGGDRLASGPARLLVASPREAPTWSGSRGGRAPGWLITCVTRHVVRNRIVVTDSACGSCVARHA
jgi:hypothetical protein